LKKRAEADTDPDSRAAKLLRLSKMIAEVDEPDGETVNERRVHWDVSTFVCVLAVLMLALALAPMPIGYYTVLRWVVAPSALFLAGSWCWRFFERSILWLLALLVVAAVVFNPIIPFWMSRSWWRILDLLTAFLFFSTWALIQDQLDKRKCA